MLNLLLKLFYGKEAVYLTISWFRCQFVAPFCWRTDFRGNSSAESLR